MIKSLHNMSLGSMSLSSTLIGTIIAVGLFVSACAPRVEILAPDKPIEINLNVKIDQEVRVRLDKEVNDLISENPDLF